MKLLQWYQWAKLLYPQYLTLFFKWPNRAGRISLNESMQPTPFCDVFVVFSGHSRV